MKTMKEMSVESLIAKSWDGRYRDQMSETEDEILVRLIDGGYLKIRNGIVFVPGNY